MRHRNAQSQMCMLLSGQEDGKTLATATPQLSTPKDEDTQGTHRQGSRAVHQLTSPARSKATVLYPDDGPF